MKAILYLVAENATIDFITIVSGYTRYIGDQYKNTTTFADIYSYLLITIFLCINFHCLNSNRLFVLTWITELWFQDSTTTIIITTTTTTTTTTKPEPGTLTCLYINRKTKHLKLPTSKVYVFALRHCR